MEQAAKNYERALENRNGVHKRPPHDPLALQEAADDYMSRVRASRDKILKIIAERYGPTRGAVTRPNPRGVYVWDGRAIFHRGPTYWNLKRDARVYLEQNGREWTSTNENSKVTRGKLDEYWGGGGFR